MNPRLQIIAKKFLVKVCQKPEYELAWLKALEHSEKLAGDFILGNITPDLSEHLQEQIKRHAHEEYQHADIFSHCQKSYGDKVRDENLAFAFCHTTSCFLNDYFSDQLLRQVSDRHAAYVHGAIGIESFPFQIYQLYTQYTQSKAVQSVISRIIEDEKEHLKLTLQMRKNLPSKVQIDLSSVKQLEMDLATLYLEQLYFILECYEKDPLHFEDLIEKQNNAFFQQANTLVQTLPGWKEDKFLRQSLLLARRRLAPQGRNEQARVSQLSGMPSDLFGLKYQILKSLRQQEGVVA